MFLLTHMNAAHDVLTHMSAAHDVLTHMRAAYDVLTCMSAVHDVLTRMSAVHDVLRADDSPATKSGNNAQGRAYHLRRKVLDRAKCSQAQHAPIMRVKSRRPSPQVASPAVLHPRPTTAAS